MKYIKLFEDYIHESTEDKLSVNDIVRMNPEKAKTLVKSWSASEINIPGANNAYINLRDNGLFKVVKVSKNYVDVVSLTTDKYGKAYERTLGKPFSTSLPHDYFIKN
jgi:hypothetical protein